MLELTRALKAAEDPLRLSLLASKENQHPPGARDGARDGARAASRIATPATRTLQEQLRAELHKNLARVLDLFRSWDVDADGCASRHLP